VLSLRRKGVKVASDGRILGGDEFIQRLLSEVEEKERETLRLSRKAPDLTSLARRIVKGEGIEELELRSGMRTRKVAMARKLFCQLAIRKKGYCGGDVARFLGVTTSAVNKAANSEEVAALQQYC